MWCLTPYVFWNFIFWIVVRHVFLPEGCEIIYGAQSQPQPPQHDEATSRIKFLDTTADSDSRSLETMSTTSSRDISREDAATPIERTTAALGNGSLQSVKKKKNNDAVMRPYTKRRRRKKTSLGHIKQRTSGLCVYQNFNSIVSCISLHHEQTFVCFSDARQWSARFVFCNCG